MQAVLDQQGGTMPREQPPLTVQDLMDGGAADDDEDLDEPLRSYLQMQGWLAGMEWQRREAYRWRWWQHVLFVLIGSQALYLLTESPMVTIIPALLYFLALFAMWMSRERLFAWYAIAGAVHVLMDYFLLDMLDYGTPLCILLACFFIRPYLKVPLKEFAEKKLRDLARQHLQ
jgi:hypothetical protein